MGSRSAARSARRLADALPWFEAGEELATRAAGKSVLNAIKPYAPTMVGGAADLVESTYTMSSGRAPSRHTRGRNIAFGVREHPWARSSHGIALDPAMLKPFGSTFLIFSDYMRPAVRLSALMGIETVWWLTHDSVVSRRGRPHAPAGRAHMALRAIPNLWYVRPADANETTIAWRIAMSARAVRSRSR